MALDSDAPRSARQRRVEPVGKPMKKHFLALQDSGAISLIFIRIVIAMILSPNDEVFLT
jgi:hypothetical protein